MDFPITLKEDANQPLYRQLCDALRESISSGRLKPGDFLPSTRKLADMLAISRVTVVRSYEELMSQGYLEAAPGSGTLVSRHLPFDDKATPPPDTVDADSTRSQLSGYGRWLMQGDDEEYASTVFPELNYGAPPLECLPLKEWRSLLSKYSRVQDSASLIYEMDPFGYLPLREALASFLKRSRAVNCEADQVALFTGAQHALNLISRVLIDPGNVVALENCGFCDARQAFLAHKASLYPVSVDSEGMVVEELKRIETKPRLVHVSPRHNTPTSVTLSTDRRKQLIDWATRTNTLIIEDDFDNEYRYLGAPVPALQSQDRSDQVIFFSSLWKTMFPLTAIHFLVIPRHLVPVFRKAKILSQRHFAIIEQYALADFIEGGMLERMIRKTGTIYKRRRQTLIFTLTRALPRQLKITENATGTSLPVRFLNPIPDEAVLAAGSEANLPMCSTRNFYLDNIVPGEFLISFSDVPETELQQRVEKFASALSPALQQA